MSAAKRVLSASNHIDVAVRSILSYLADTEDEEENILDEIDIHTRAYEYMIQEIRNPNEDSECDLDDYQDRKLVSKYFFETILWGTYLY